MEIIKIVFKTIFYIMDIFIIFYALYYIITGLFAFYNKNGKIRKYKAKTRFAILIAARNEEKVIGNLLDSLNKQNYPKELYDIFVIPNNCTDKTREIAVNKGATIIDCQVPVSSKGDALKFSFKFMLQNYPEYEAYCIFDADNIVHPNFLKRMNDAKLAGYKVAQGYRDSKNPSDTWISSCYSLYYLVQNYFFNQARMNMGWSSSINGTGFMISKEVITEYGFNTITLTEDIEFAAQCALNNTKIAFVKDAITYDEQPLSFSQSWKQRKRWSIGTFQCLFKYSGKLLKEGVKRKIPQSIDMSLFFLAPIMQVLTFIMILLFVVYNILGIHISDFISILYDNKVYSLIIGYLITVFVTLFVVLVEKKKIKNTFKGILTLSIFMLTWIPINIVCLVKREQVWEPIEHKRTIDIDTIVEINTK